MTEGRMTEEQRPRGSQEPLDTAYDVALLDLDGVVYLGGTAIPGAAEALRKADAAGMRLAYVTNNAFRTPAAIAALLTSFGAPASPQPSAVPLRIRMALHTGAAEYREDAYEGYLTLARVQRLMSVAHGGQIVVSTATEELLHDALPEKYGFLDLGAHRLRDLSTAAQSGKWANKLLPGLLTAYNRPFAAYGGKPGHVMAVPTALARIT